MQKACIIGFGSIGKRHYKIISNQIGKKNTFVLSRRNINIKNSINTIKELVLINPDYFIIATETSEHINILNKLIKNFKNKIILVEKPLSNKNITIKKFNNNKIFIAYNLRFHPVIQYISSFINKKKIWYADIFCNSYLPDWRTSNYKLSYSADRNRGGGVLYDLSHEIDYCKYLFGNFKKKFSFNSKISNLNIKSDDILLLILSSKKIPVISISLNYFSKFSKRTINIYNNNFQIHADLNNNFIKIKEKNNKEKIIKFKKSIDQSYKIMHQKILKKNFNNLCKFSEALDTNLFLNSIKYNKL